MQPAYKANGAFWACASPECASCGPPPPGLFGCTACPYSTDRWRDFEDHATTQHPELLREDSSRQPARALPGYRASGLGWPELPGYDPETGYDLLA